MTIEEAIEHCKEVAHEKRIESSECISVNDLENAEACYECGEEHKQLAEWLTELKQRREAEITAPPKSNADRIRQMTDEELAEFLEKNCSCPNCCVYHPASCKHIRAQCIEGYNKWLRKEVSEDAGTD